MAIVYSKNISLVVGALTDAAAGDGTSGYNYGYAHIFWIVKNFLVTQVGYTVTVSSSRGSGTLNVANSVSSSDLWGSPYAVAYEEAYCGLRFPAYRGVTRRILLQRGTGAPHYGRFKINRTADYTTGGSATAVRPQTISGEKLWLGGGSDTSRSYDIGAPGVDLTVQCIGDTSTGGFVVFGYSPAGTAVGGVGFFLAFDPFSVVPESGQDDAALIYTPTTTPTWAGQLAEESSAACRAWCRLGLSGADFVGVSMRSALGVGTSPASPRTGNKPVGEIWYGRDAAPAELLGKSSLFSAYGPVGGVPRTSKITNAKDRIVCGQLETFWDQTEPS